MPVLMLLLSASVARVEAGAPEGASLTQRNATVSAAKRARITAAAGVADLPLTPCEHPTVDEVVT
jgi:hypothetical protein